MKRIGKYIFLLFFPLHLLHAQDLILPAPDGGSVPAVKFTVPYIPWTGDTSWTGDGQRKRFFLQKNFPVPGSVLIRSDTLNGPFIRDFAVESIPGAILFGNAPEAGKKIYVTYRYRPVSLKVRYRKWTVSENLSGPGDSSAVTGTRVLIPKSPEEDGGEPGDRDLQKSGTLFRGLSMGTDQGMRLQSGLRFQVSGKIARNVEVTASLTDQNTPIQPEGNTQTLQEIDKVFVNIKAPHFQANLGDLVFTNTGMEFSEYTRKLQGALAAGESSFGRVSLLAAASKGQFATNHFEGREGNQGPYQLTGTNGETDIIVLAGTERVWINGVPMTRGEDNDYVIEYSLGQVTFTRHRLITGDSRMTVDFEYSMQKFQKSIYGAHGETSFWKDRIRLQAALLRESDDKENPIDIPLTDAYRQALSAAGDNPDSAAVDGARDVGAGKGDYMLDPAYETPVYRYAGENQGNYQVQFSHVGYGNGDYSFQGYGIYRYEGPGKGTYLPVVRLPLARMHQTAGLAYSVKAAEGISIHGEAAVSEQDLNLYSGRDDGDNSGNAYSGAFEIQERPVHAFGLSISRIGINAKIRRTGGRFRTLGRSEEIEHGRKWGVSEGMNWGERTREVETLLSPVKDLTFRGSLGDFSRGNVESARKALSVQFIRPRFPSLNYVAERIDTRDGIRSESGWWLRQKGDLQAALLGLSAQLLYEGEHRKDSSPDSAATGFSFDEWTGKIGYKRGSVLAEVEQSVRDDRKYSADASLERYSLAGTGKYSLGYKGGRLQSSVAFTARTRDYSDSLTPDQKSNLADMKIRYALPDRSLEGNLYYQYSSTSVAEMVRDTIQLGSGLGNYRYDEFLKELVPDPDGDLILRMVQTGVFLPVNDMKAALEWNLDGSQAWKNKRGFLSVLAKMKSRTQARFERKDREKSFSAVNRRGFHPSWNSDSTAVSGLFSVLEDIEAVLGPGKLSILLRLRKDDSINRQMVQEGLIRNSGEQMLRIKANPARQWGILAEYRHRKDLKRYESRPLSNRDIVNDQWTGELSFRPRQKLELAVKARFIRSSDRAIDPVTNASGFFMAPRISLAFLGRGQLRSEWDFGRVKSEPGGMNLPYEMLDGEQTGNTFRWTLLSTYRLSGHMQATLSYRARREPWRDRILQVGQVEIRAFF